MRPLDTEGPATRGLRRGLSAALALLPMIAVIVASAANASASTTLPVAPTLLQASASNKGLQMEPKTITYTGDGTGFLGGASVTNTSSGIHWTKWTSDVAVGTGYNQLNNCKPFCAAGTFHGYRVKIEMWRPRSPEGTLVFTRMTIWYKHGRPAGEPHHYTFTDVFVGGISAGYSWDPPAEQGYCVHTEGQPAFAGCKNIHSLP